MLALAALLLDPQGLAPLDWLVGHCWTTEIAPGTVDTHCFRRDGNEVRDRHDVTHQGKTVYWGETRYRWDAAAHMIRFAYLNAEGPVAQGIVTARGDVLDFGTARYAGTPIRVTWKRLATGYESIAITNGRDTVRRVFTRGPPSPAPRPRR